MKTATNDGLPVTAGPDAPQTATCPDCGATVHLRKRKRTDHTTTWFYRHARNQGHDCPRRYRPT